MEHQEQTQVNYEALNKKDKLETTSMEYNSKKYLTQLYG